MEHLTANPGIGKPIAKAFQRIKIGSRPTVRTINLMDCFANNPTNTLLGASSQKPFVSPKIA